MDHEHHQHHHHHDHHRGRSRLRPEGGRAGERRALLLALGLTTGVMILELVGGVLSHSLALRADAGHMLTDASALVLAILALWFAEKPADLRRTFGFYRLEILAALLNGVVLVVLSGVIIWEALERIRQPPELHAGTMLLVATISLCANATGLFFLHRQQGTLNMRGAYLHLLGDTASSVGVILAAIIALFTGFTLADPLVSLGIALVIIWSAVRLVREAVDVLLEAVPAHLDIAEVLHAMERTRGVAQVHDLHIWTISSGMHALAAHVVIETSELGKNDEILRSIRAVLHERFEIDHATLQIETPAHCEEAPQLH